MSLDDQFQILIELIRILKHGKALITWQDGHIVKIEKIETEAKITK